MRADKRHRRLSPCLTSVCCASLNHQPEAQHPKIFSYPQARRPIIPSEKSARLSESVVIQFFDHETAEAGMRGAFVDQGGLFSYIAPEARVPSNHPLRKIRILVRDVLGELNRSLGKLYASDGTRRANPVA
jgi:hypothetical protein